MTDVAVSMRSAWSPHRQEFDGEWDAFIEASMNGTILHTRRFLSYHGDRFTDCSLLLRDERGRIVAVFAAAEDPEDGTTVVSHPGVTYGGIVHDKSLRGETMVDALSSLAGQLATLGYARLRYTPVPWVYHRRHAADDLFALHRLGAVQIRSELVAAIDLAAPVRADRKTQWAMNRARRLGVEITPGWDDLEAMWEMVEANLADRYGAVPTHSVEEIRLLRRLCPDELDLSVAKIGDQVVAGVLVFTTGAATHTQYISSTEVGRRAQALDPLLASALESARARSSRFFCFGTSSTDTGRGINQSLYEFKLSFGAGSVPQQQFELVLQPE